MTIALSIGHIEIDRVLSMPSWKKPDQRSIGKNLLATVFGSYLAKPADSARVKIQLGKKLGARP